LASLADRIRHLLALDPGLGGMITLGFRVDASDARRIPPRAALAGYPTPWGWQPGLLDGSGLFAADLDLLPPESLASLAQRLDGGDCTLIASADEAPWAHLADRVAFLVPQGERAQERPPAGRPIATTAAITTIATAAAAWAIEGHRAEAFTLRAALAIARADGRRRLREGDVAEAIGLVLAPRARTAPQAQPPSDSAPTQTPGSDAQAEAPPLPVAPISLPAPQGQTRTAIHGAPVRSVPARRRRGSLDLPGTLLAALPWQRLRGAMSRLPPALHPTDLRWHLHRPRHGRLIIFLVDASGSMGRRRLGQAKGAVLRLLQEAYRRRDHVAVILAAGPQARLLLPPARAVEQARRALATVPAGGGTPLAGALLLACRLAAAAHQRDQRHSLLLLLTDGRANQPLPGTLPDDIEEQVKRSSLAVRRQTAMQSVILSEPGAEVRALSRWLQAPLLPVTRLKQAAAPAGLPGAHRGG
jgi:magnesium chelatase subunit D